MRIRDRDSRFKIVSFATTTEFSLNAVAPGGSVRGERANLTRLVLSCIEAKFCKKICVGKLSPKSTQCTPSHRFGIESQQPGKPWGSFALFWNRIPKTRKTRGRKDPCTVLESNPKKRGKPYRSQSTIFCLKIAEFSLNVCTNFAKLVKISLKFGQILPEFAQFCDLT